MHRALAPSPLLLLLSPSPSPSLTHPRHPDAQQVVQLERALARGRRQVPVVQMAEDLDMSRDAVLTWLRINGRP